MCPHLEVRQRNCLSKPEQSPAAGTARSKLNLFPKTHCSTIINASSLLFESAHGISPHSWLLVLVYLNSASLLQMFSTTECFSARALRRAAPSTPSLLYHNLSISLWLLSQDTESQEQQACAILAVPPFYTLWNTRFIIKKGGLSPVLTLGRFSKL